MKKLLKALGAALLGAVLMAAFYLAVIMGNPQEETAVPREAQPLLTSMGAPLMTADAGQLSALLGYFPAQAMAAGNTSLLTFASGTCQDVAFEGGLGRSVTLTYRIAMGGTLTVQSIYPARALSLIEKEDYAFSTASGGNLAGLRSVRMENASAIRLHAQGAEALYVVTLPKLSAQDLRTLTATLQLYQGEQP